MIRLDHINIHAENLDAARDFLLAVLPDLTQGFRPPFDFKGYWLYLDGKPLIHMQNRGAGLTGGGQWIDHIAFAPFDFAVECKRLDALAMPYVVGGIPGTGIRQLFITGPEGLKLELQCPDTSF
jgi:catechol 2,3-dioxygenase-like lactoylglutathione lyase family enzyme